MNGCIYRTADDKCEFWSDYGKNIVSYCDFEDCDEKKPSNADRIRSMTDGELAVWLYWKADGSGKTKDQWLEWLREECNE